MKGFSLIEMIICIGLLAFLVQLFTTSAWAVRESIARTETQSTLQDEEIILFDQLENRLPITYDGLVSVDHLILTSPDQSAPAIRVDIKLSATTTQGQRRSESIVRTIWPNI